MRDAPWIEYYDEYRNDAYGLMDEPYEEDDEGEDEDG